MFIEKKIKLGDSLYFVVVNVCYVKDEFGIKKLQIKDYKNSYFDSGDFSLLCGFVQKNYTINEAMKYDKDIPYMGDVLYIYNRIPFLYGIRECYFSKDDLPLYTSSFILKDEIDDYIVNNDIKMKNMDGFELVKSETWIK